MGRKYRIANKKKFMKRIIQLLSVLIILSIVLFAIMVLMNLAEDKTKDFVIDNYIMPKNLYSSRADAVENVFITEDHWRFDEYCFHATINLMYNDEKVATTLVITVPTLKYALNLDSAKEELKIVGEC